jgi:putative transcriptional regulator
MEPVPYSHLTKGSLLIATAEIDDPFFSRSVMLICEHSSNGSFGLVINKELDIELPEEVLDVENLVNPNIHTCAGGPMQPNQMILLHSSDKIPEETLKVCDGVYLGGDLQFLHESATSPEGPHILLCFGYGGWGPGQLEQEYLDGHWLLHPASARYLFDIPADKLWQTILRDMGGKNAALSMMPEDLSLN